jgi:hypothetical protein
MANVDSKNGFIPYCYKDGKPYTGQARTYYKAVTSAPIFVGDPVVRIVSVDANGFPAIDRATTGAAVTGHVVGIKINPDDLTKASYLAAGDTGYVEVCDDPNVLLLVQEGGSGTALALAQIGKHIDAIAAVDGNTTTGSSNYEVDNAAVATGNTYRIEAMAEAVMIGNALGADQKVLVAVNLSTEVNAGASSLSEV